MRGAKEHEDMDRDTDSDEVTNKLGARVGARAPSLITPQPPKIGVGVREPLRPVPRELFATAGVPIPALQELLPDAIGTFIEGIGETPGLPPFTASDFEFLRREVDFTPFRVAKGVARSVATRAMQNQIAEAAVSRVVQEIDLKTEKVTRPQEVPQNGSKVFPWWIFGIPLVYEILKLADLTPGFRASLTPDPLRGTSRELLEGKQLQDRNLAREFAKPTKPARVVPPSPAPLRSTPAGGGKDINAATLLQGQIQKVRRTVTPTRRQDPNL